MMNSVVEQAELSLSRRPTKVDMPIELIRNKKTAGAAFTFACDTSGLDDKEIYMPLEIDKGYFSNIKSGKATLQGDLIEEFCRIVGNRIYPEWLAYQVGCTLVQIESETQRQLRIEQERRMEAEKENQLLKKLLIGQAA
jgi:hypothetical protein